MFCHFTVNDPDKVNATLAMTMTLKQWEELREQLQSKWPSCDLSIAITELLHDMRKRGFWQEPRPE